MPAAAAGSGNEEHEATLKRVCHELGGVTILQKGAVDLISDGEALLRCNVSGGPRRSGGLGDILAGTLGIVSAWARMGGGDSEAGMPWAGQEQLWAALAACSITRSSCAAAFAKQKRSTTAVHVLAELGQVFEGYCPAVPSAAL